MATTTETWTLTTEHRTILRYADGTFSETAARCSCSKTVDGTTTQNPSDGRIEYSYDEASWTEGNEVQSSDLYTNGRSVAFRLVVRNSVVLKSTVTLVQSGGDPIIVTYSGGRAEVEITPAIALGNNNIHFTLSKGTATEASGTVSLIPNGLPGASAAQLDVRPSVFFVKANSDGVSSSLQKKKLAVQMYVNGKEADITDVSVTKNGSTSVSVWLLGLKSDGYNLLLSVSEGSSEQSYSGSLNITVTGTYNGKSYKGFASIPVESNRKGESGTGVGPKGFTGPTIRGPRTWDDHTEYRNDTNSETGGGFIDIVLHKGTFYQCILTHNTQKSSTYAVEPPSDTYWVVAEDFEFVATKVLLAERAKIANLVVEELEARTSLDNLVSGVGKYTWVSGGAFEIGQFTVREDGSYNDTVAYDIGLVDGKAYLRFWEDGELVGIINSDIFSNQERVSDSWTYANFVGPSALRPTDYYQYVGMTGTQYWKLTSGWSIVAGVKTLNYPDDDGKWFASQSVTSSNYMPDGYYVDPTVYYKRFTELIDGEIKRQAYMNVYSVSSGTMTLSTSIFGPIEETGIKPSEE